MTRKEKVFFDKLGIVAASTGSAVGLGNIWRFPYLLGQSGGGAFLVVYLICVIFLGLPVMISEFSIGRMAQANAVTSFRSLAPIRPRSKPEAIAVFRYLADSERMDNTETESILLNLIG